MEKKRLAMHFNEMLHLLAVAEERRQTVNIRAWKEDGQIVEYKGWLIHHDYWKGGYIRLRNPVNREIRTLPEIFIFEINNYHIYL